MCKKPTQGYVNEVSCLLTPGMLCHSQSRSQCTMYSVPLVAFGDPGELLKPLASFLTGGGI